VVGFKVEFGLGEESLGEGGPVLLQEPRLPRLFLAWAALGSSPEWGVRCTFRPWHTVRSGLGDLDAPAEIFAGRAVVVPAHRW
jgi:hypothetical protein